jgi:hypothetical protein
MLGRRENRFSHNTASFPFNTVVPTALTGARASEDVILDNVVAFDVQLFDPGAPQVVPSGSSDVLEPKDPNYVAAVGGAGSTIVGYGAYADLNWGKDPPGLSPARWGGSPYPPATLPAGAPAPWFAGDPPYPPVTGWSPSTVPSNATYAIYDTWTTAYELSGPDGAGNYGPGPGIDGLDSPTANGIVDDQSEWTTAAPYSKPLRGIRITIRVYEPDSKQIRQITVVQDFVPR